MSKTGQGPPCLGESQGQAHSLNVLGILSHLIGLFYENSLILQQTFYQQEQILPSDFPSVLDYTRVTGVSWYTTAGR